MLSYDLLLIGQYCLLPRANCVALCEKWVELVGVAKVVRSTRLYHLPTNRN